MSRTRRNPPMMQIRPGLYRVGFTFALVWERPEHEGKHPWQWFVRQGLAGEATSREKAYRAVKAAYDAEAPERAASHVLEALVGQLRMLVREKDDDARTKLRDLERIVAAME